MILTKHQKDKNMKKVQVIIIEQDDKFIAKDQAGKIYYTGKRKADVKRSVTKGSRKDEFELVNGFAIEEQKEVETPVKEVETPKPVKEVKKPTIEKGKPAKTTYVKYKAYIITNFLSEDLFSKSPKIADFCKEFDLKLNKASRNLSFEKVLDLMMVEGLIEYREPQKGKYKKLSFKYTDQHEAAMSPDEEEEL
jgi:hypothetical protein